MGLLGSALVFDDFPFGLLTMIVSLEAIFLSTFVMISQNREAARADVRAELDFKTNLEAEILVRAMAKHVGVTWRRRPRPRRDSPRQHELATRA